MLPKIGVLNISDRASAGIYEDTPGKACVTLLQKWLITKFEVDSRVIPDERDVIEAELKRMADEAGCSLVVTTGGTGPAPRDVTPEATTAVPTGARTVDRSSRGGASPSTRRSHPSSRPTGGGTARPRRP